MKRQLALLTLLTLNCAGEKPTESSRFFTPTRYGESPEVTVDAATTSPTDTHSDQLDAQLRTPEDEMSFWGIEDRPILTPEFTYDPPSGVDRQSDTRLNIAFLLPVRYESRRKRHITWLADKTRRKYLRVNFEERPDLTRVFDLSWAEGTIKYYHLPWGPSTLIAWSHDITAIEIDLDPPPGEFRRFLSHPFTIHYTIFEPDTQCHYSLQANIDFSDSRHERVSGLPEHVEDWSEACADP